jgi:hypothetical protein
MLAKTAACLLLAILVAVPTARAAPLSPADGSDLVLAARPGAQAELRLIYQKDVNGKHPEALTVGLARDYDYLETPSLRTIHDYRLRRIFRYQPAFIATYVNDSLYAEVWRRAIEVQSRSTQAGVVPQAGIGPEKGLLTLSPFWAESELGIIAPSFPRPLMLKRSEVQGRLSWSLDGLEVVAVRWHEERPPDEIKGAVARLWTSLAPIHPQILEQLSATGRIPEELWVQAPEADHRHLARLHWKLTATEWAPAASFPLPPRLRASPTESSGVYPEIFATLATAVAKRLQPPASSVYMDKIRTAVSEGAGLQAMLWQMEMRLAQGPLPPECVKNDRRPSCALTQVATSLAESDERTGVAFAKQSPALEQRSAFDDLPNAYFLRLLWATRPPGAKVTFAESERGVLSALTASPVANFCKDAGDFYAATFKAFAAWQIWDLGRLMSGHRQGDLLDEIDGLEARLAQDYPAFF